MNNGLKLLLMAAGAIVTCIVVVVGFQLTKSGKSDTNKATEQYTALSAEYDDVKLSAYDDVTLSGADIIKSIKECDELLKSTEYNFSIVVKTNLNPTTGTTYENDYETDLETNTSSKNSTANDYINPSAQFKGAISRNENGVIYMITFSQKK